MGTTHFVPKKDLPGFRFREIFDVMLWQRVACDNLFGFPLIPALLPWVREHGIFVSGVVLDWETVLLIHRTSER